MKMSVDREVYSTETKTWGTEQNRTEQALLEGDFTEIFYKR